jgi:hypothetical protein
MLAEMVVGDPRPRASYERRIRIASEAASWGIGAALLGTAALPTTDQASRIGLVASSLLLFLFAAPCSARAADCIPIHEAGQHIG